MKILLTEAFSNSMPENIRKWMQQYGGTYSRKFSNNRASLTKDFDPASAEFQDVSHLSVNTLREYLKARSHVIFAEVDVDRFSGPVTVAIYSDPDNTTNKLKLLGDNTGALKEKSFKWIIENALSVYATPINEEVSNVRAARRDARKGLVSREGDSAQNSEGRWSFNGEDWKKDASGYWHDANRLARKLSEIHAEDVGYYYKKASEIFISMANTFADTIKTLAANPEDLSFDTFGDGSFERLTREGQRLLRDVGEKMGRIKAEVEHLAYNLEDINKVRSEQGSEPISEEELKESQKYSLKTVQRYFSEIQQSKRELSELIA